MLLYKSADYNRDALRKIDEKERERERAFRTSGKCNTVLVSTHDLRDVMVTQSLDQPTQE